MGPARKNLFISFFSWAVTGMDDELATVRGRGSPWREYSASPTRLDRLEDRLVKPAERSTGACACPAPSLSTSCVFWCARPHRLRPKGSAFRSVSGLLAKGFHVSSLRNGGCRVGVQYSSGKQLSSHCHGNIQSVAVAEDNYSVNRAGSEAWLVPS